MTDDEASLPSALGNWAGGASFWDREVEVADVLVYLGDGASVTLTGPRRMGKTSVARRVLERLPQATIGLFIDAEGYRSPAEFYAAIAAAAHSHAGLWAKLRTRLGRLTQSLNLESVEAGPLKIALQAAMSANWRDDATVIVRALAEGDGAVVIAVDELPLLLDRLLKDDPSEAELLLGTMRAHAQEFRSVTWLVSGSVGMEPILQRAGLTGLITHLRAYPIPPWDEATTTAAVQALLRHHGLAIEAAAARTVHACLGIGVPYHVQLLVDELRRDARKRQVGAISPHDVSRVYRGPALQSALHAHLLHLETRLRNVLGEGDSLRLALDLLTETAVVGTLTSSAALILAAESIEDATRRTATLREVLGILEHDLYVAPGADGHCFASRLISDWWERRHGTGYVPADQRRRPAE